MNAHDYVSEEMHMAICTDAILMAEACNYLGKPDEARNLLQAVEQLFPIFKMWQLDKMNVLLAHVEIQHAPSLSFAPGYHLFTAQ